MRKLLAEDLYPLETYARLRSEFRAQVMEHKRHRRLSLGEHLTLYFEDRLTMHYQVQEMLRAERIFEPRDIQAELDAYNPLIPDGNNWKATMMIEYADAGERKAALQRLVGIENAVWMAVGKHEPVRAIADEDLERSADGKTSAVHFLRFELGRELIDDLKAGAPLGAGVSHEAYSVTIDPLPQMLHESLIADLA